MDSLYRYDVYCSECGSTGQVVTDKLVTPSRQGALDIKSVGNWDVVDGR